MLIYILLYELLENFQRLKNLVVKPSTVEKLKQFHPWIYKDEIKKIPKGVVKGDLIKVISPKGEFLGIGYINPDSVITVRILTFDNEEINKKFFFNRIQKAFNYRQEIFDKITDAYRIVHSEGDFLSGLIVDKYADYLSIQFNTAGINNFRKEIIESLIEIFNPKGIYEKVDEKIIKIEGLEENKEQTIYGEVPDEIIITENSLKFIASIKQGQKTGLFLDQRKNRKIVSSYVKNGFKVLDLFSNSGGFGIYALKEGAKFANFVDISQVAVSQIDKNCKLNGFKNYNIVKADAFDYLNNLDKKFNLIIIDPPAFAKTKKEKTGAIKGFQFLVINSIKALEENGYIALFSCSHHITEEDLKKILLFASQKTGKKLIILEKLMQDLDHPYLLNAPPTFYLKGFLIKVV